MPSYDPNVPVQTASPGLFPPQNSGNFTRLQTIIESEHVFNKDPTANDGWHKQVTMLSRDAPGSLPAGSNGIVFSRLNTTTFYSWPWWYNGTLYPMTPVLAMVNFDGTGPNANPIDPSLIRSSLNVGSVTKTDTGAYRINFSPALPNNKYIVQVTGMSNTLGQVVTGCVKGDPIYGNEVTTSALEVRFAENGGTFVNVRMGSVTILGVTV